MLPDMLDEFIVGHQIPNPPTAIPERESDMQIPPQVFLINSNAAFELHPQGLAAIFVVSQKIGPQPIILQLNAVKAVVGEVSGDFLEIINLFLLGVEFSVPNRL